MSDIFGRRSDSPPVIKVESVTNKYSHIPGFELAVVRNSHLVDNNGNLFVRLGELEGTDDTAGTDSLLSSLDYSARRRLFVEPWQSVEGEPQVLIEYDPKYPAGAELLNALQRAIDSLQGSTMDTASEDEEFVDAEMGGDSSPAGWLPGDEVELVEPIPDQVQRFVAQFASELSQLFQPLFQPPCIQPLTGKEENAIAAWMARASKPEPITRQVVQDLPCPVMYHANTVFGHNSVPNHAPTPAPLVGHEDKPVPSPNRNGNVFDMHSFEYPADPAGDQAAAKMAQPASPPPLNEKVVGAQNFFQQSAATKRMLEVLSNVNEFLG